MRINKFSKKQGRIFRFMESSKSALICDGAVRSGKTAAMSLAFVIWAMNHFDRTNFGICGKTVSNAERNIILPLLTIEGLPFRAEYHRSKTLLTLHMGDKENYFYLFGGKDESSYMLIQGITLAGVLFDEVVLMPRSFVDQAIARTFTFPGRKLWFNCNPGSPQHWFYKEWIQDVEKHRATHLHFTMHDNPVMTDEMIEEVEKDFTGVFYDRYIRGLWVVAEGLIYSMFNPDIHITDKMPTKGRYFISVDYGTMNPFSAGLWCLVEDKAYRIGEYYYSGREGQSTKTDEEYYTELDRLAGDLDIERIIIDPSAASFKAVIRKYGKYSVRDARNSVIDGIRYVSSLMKSNKLYVSKTCKRFVEEIKLYSWDSKFHDDKVIKDHDHAMDDMRYFAYTILHREWRHLVEDDS